MRAKDEHIQAYAEYFMILSAIKQRCDAEDVARGKEPALQGESLSQQHHEHT
jgi:hypothetical protein